MFSNIAFSFLVWGQTWFTPILRITQIFIWKFPFIGSTFALQPQSLFRTILLVGISAIYYYKSLCSVLWQVTLLTSIKPKLYKSLTCSCLGLNCLVSITHVDDEMREASLQLFNTQTRIERRNQLCVFKICVVLQVRSSWWVAFHFYR